MPIEVSIDCAPLFYDSIGNTLCFTHAVQAAAAGVVVYTGLARVEEIKQCVVCSGEKKIGVVCDG